jgi:hypothetical protein
VANRKVHKLSGDPEVIASKVHPFVGLHRGQMSRLDRQKTGTVVWVVDVFPSLSPTSKHQQFFFVSKAETAVVWEHLGVRKDNFRTRLNALTPTRIAEAAILDKLEEDAGSLIRLIREKRSAAHMQDYPITVSAVYSGGVEGTL